MSTLRRSRAPYAEAIVAFPALLLVLALRSGLPWAPIGEPPRYFAFAGRVLDGLMPYRDAPLEYPPLALVPWMVPRLLASDVHTYSWLLALQNAALAAGVAICLAWLARQGWAASSPTIVLATGLLLLLGVAHVVVWLFDLLPALLLALAIVAVARERPAMAGVALGLGGLVKLFPLVLVPVLVLWYLATSRRRAAGQVLVAGAVTVGIVMLPLVAIAGSGAFSFLDYQRDRGAQLESLPAGLAMLAAQLGGAPTTLVHAFGAWQIDGQLAGWLADIQAPVLVGGLVLLLGLCALRFRQDRRELGAVPPGRLIAYATAGVLLLMIANKVLSPQFLVWLLPLAPLLPRGQAALAVSASMLTAVFLGANYEGLMQQRWDLVLVLDLRNLLLVLLFAWIIVANLPSRAATSSVVLTAR